MRSVAWNGTLLASGSMDKTIKIWDTESCDCVETFSVPSRGVFSVVWNGAGTLAAPAFDTIKMFNFVERLTKPESAAGQDA